MDQRCACLAMLLGVVMDAPTLRDFARRRLDADEVGAGWSKARVMDVLLEFSFDDVVDQLTVPEIRALFKAMDRSSRGSRRELVEDLGDTIDLFIAELEDEEGDDDDLDDESDEGDGGHLVDEDGRAPCLYAVMLTPNKKGAWLYVGSSGWHSAACKFSLHKQHGCVCARQVLDPRPQSSRLVRTHGMHLFKVRELAEGTTQAQRERLEHQWAQTLADEFGLPTWSDGARYDPT